MLVSWHLGTPPFSNHSWLRSCPLLNTRWLAWSTFLFYRGAYRVAGPERFPTRVFIGLKGINRLPSSASARGARGGDLYFSLKEGGSISGERIGNSRQVLFFSNVAVYMRRRSSFYPQAHHLAPYSTALLSHGACQLGH